MSGSDEDSQDKKREHVSSSDENSKDEPIQSRLRVKKTKSSNIYSSSSEEEVSDDDKKKKKSKGKGRPPAKSTKSKVEQNDVEEGEVSDESSDGESSDEMEFLDGYDENLLGDDEDRERLARMTEREREEEIFKRLEHRQAMQRRHELERKLRKRASQAGKSKKSLTNAVDDTSARSKERRLIVEGKKDTKAKAIEDLRAAREEKKSRAAEQEKKKAAVKPRKRRDTESDEEDDDEEEEDLKDVKRKQVESSSDSDSETSETGRRNKDGGRDISQEPVQNFSELEKIRLSRFRLAKWLYLPQFADLVKGFYVRVNFGDMEQGRPVYRIAEILGVGESFKPYDFAEPGSNKSIMTTVTLRLRVFEREKEMNMTFVSNQSITEKEFSEFKHRMANRDMLLPTREHVEKKLNEYNQANNYQLTDADITQMVAQKEKLGMKPKNLAMRKAQLVKMKESAIRLNDLDELARLQPELDQLQLAMKERDAPRQAGQVKIEAINRRNQSAAMEALGKALSTRDQKKESDRGTDDPFTRRWGTPLLVHKKGEKDKLPVDLKIETVDVKATPTPAELVPVKADPFNVHNFDIGLNIDIGDFPLPSSSFSRRTK